MTPLDSLIDYIFAQENASPLAQEFAGWMRESRRYRTFAETYKDKIRRKYRLAQSDDGVKDLRCELETAAILLREERFTLKYEKYASLKQRRPDFTVTFKTHTPFNVEVRRVRGRELDDAGTEASVNKLMAVVCDKVGQMPPAVVNLLWMVAEHEITESDLTNVLTTLRLLAERKTEDFFTRRGFASATDFLRQYRHLSGVVVRRDGAGFLWLNALARHKPPPEMATAIRRLSS